MLRTHDSNLKRISVIYWCVSLLTGMYLVFKAALVPPLMDEVTTFFVYVQTGSFQPYYSHLDANNHILNSLFTRLSYLAFGDSIFALRLPNLLAFVLYSWIGFRFLKEFKSDFARYSWILFLFFQHAVLSYFSITRGYGMSFALLLTASYYTYQLITIPAARAFVSALLASVLMIFANLSLLPLSLMIFCTAAFFFLRKRQTAGAYVTASVASLVFVLSFWYLYGFAQALQDSGHLYLSGGVSLHETLVGRWSEEIGGGALGKWTVYTLLGVALGLILLNIRRLGLRTVLFPAFFVGACAAMYISNTYLGINYPPTRATLHLLIVLALMIVILLDETRIRWAAYTAVVPAGCVLVTFVLAFTVRYNPAWIHEAVPMEFAEIVQADNKSRTIPATVSCDGFVSYTWNFYNFRMGNSINQNTVTHFPDTACDYIILMAYENVQLPSSYELVSECTTTGHQLMKKKTPLPAYRTYEIGTVSNSGWLDMLLCNIHIDSGSSGTLHVGISYEMERTRPHQALWLIGTAKQSIQQENIDLHRIREENTRQINSMPMHYNSNDTIIAIGAWNVDSLPFTLKNVEIIIGENPRVKKVEMAK